MSPVNDEEPLVVITTLLTLMATHRDGYKCGQSAVQAEWDKQTIAVNITHNQALQDARAKEQQLADELNALQRKQHDESKRHTAQLNDLLAKLRQRPDRATKTNSMPTNASSESGCTGRQLARPDAEFLARYAADAQRLQLSLEQCQAAYNSARITFKQTPMTEVSP